MALKSKAKKAEQTEEALKKLDRFAGSSDEEESDDDDEQEVVVEKADSRNNAPVQKQDSESDHEEYSTEDDSSRNEDESVDDDDDGNRAPPAQLQLTSGMANAMARILSSTTGATTKPVVLSKTRTKLQVAAAKEKQDKKELQETRRLNRERKLTALHIPLSIATTTTSTSTETRSVAAVELEQERMHRRVATRGIVALFNAISTHQHQQPAAAVATEAVTDTTKGKKLTKDGFLDMIKQTAATKTETSNASSRKKQDTKWNALKDDYMMDSKKNWDEESSEEEEEAPKKKRHKTRT